MIVVGLYYLFNVICGKYSAIDSERNLMQCKKEII